MILPSLASAVFVAALEIGSPFGDGMVLQRGRRVPVWGWAVAGASVTVAFGGQTKMAVAGKDGAWRVNLDPLTASSKGQTLLVSTTTASLRLADVLVGEVWFACGQSNMDLPLVGDTPRYRDRNGALLAQITRMPRVRFMRSEWDWTPEPLARTKRRPAWRAFTPENLSMRYVSPSAVAFYFARELHIALDVPIGLVCAYANGTGIDTWTPREGTATRPDLRDLAEWKCRPAADWPTEWNTFPMLSPVQQPAVMWNASVNPIAPYALRGVVWYQGCHNYSESGRYVSKMHALVDGWRLKFENPDLRFYYAQLAACFGTVALAQAQYEREGKDVAMAVTCDTCNPDDIHPNDKETVGRRLALKALTRDYGFADVEDTSPVVRTANGCGPESSIPAPCRTRPSRRSGTNLVLRAPGVTAPRQVRHHIEPPFRSTLYNEANLPLGPLVLPVESTCR